MLFDDINQINIQIRLQDFLDNKYDNIINNNNLKVRATLQSPFFYIFSRTSSMGQVYLSPTLIYILFDLLCVTHNIIYLGQIKRRTHELAFFVFKLNLTTLKASFFVLQLHAQHSFLQSTRHYLNQKHPN